MSTAMATRRRRAAGSRDTMPWTGDYRRYDLVKEFTAALAVMAALTVILAIAFSSPDKPAISLAAWARAAPGDFVATAVAELGGTSGTATYGAPYTNDPGSRAEARAAAAAALGRRTRADRHRSGLCARAAVQRDR